LTRNTIKIGEILVEQGVLSEQQVFEVLQAQKQHRMPFGVLAERMFDVTLHSIENAWVEQYHRFTGTIDLSNEKFDNEALRVLNRRQAWQFELLPIRTEPDGEMLMAASANRLARAVTFAANRIDRAVYFRIAEQDQLREFLQQHYPMPELSREIIQKARDLAESA
jgi:MshEN domain